MTRGINISLGRTPFTNSSVRSGNTTVRFTFTSGGIASSSTLLLNYCSRASNTNFCIANQIINVFYGGNISHYRRHTCQRNRGVAMTIIIRPTDGCIRHSNAQCSVVGLFLGNRRITYLNCIPNNNSLVRAGCVAVSNELNSLCLCCVVT